MSEPSPSVDGVFTYVKRVQWGHCDPAQIAYTARLPEFALEAVDAWWEEHFGHGWYQMEMDLGFGTPFVHLSLDFRAPVTPRHRLEIRVKPVRLGGSSIRFDVAAYQGGVHCFDAGLVSVFATPGPKKIGTPDDVRALVEPLIAAPGAVRD